MSPPRFEPDTSRIHVTNATFLSTIFCCAYFNAHKQQSTEYQLPQTTPTVLAPALPLQTRTLSLTTDYSTDRTSIYRRPPHIPGALTLPPPAITLFPIQLRGVESDTFTFTYQLAQPICSYECWYWQPSNAPSALGWSRSSTGSWRKTTACTAPSVVIHDSHGSSSVPSTKTWNYQSFLFTDWCTSELP